MEASVGGGAPSSCQQPQGRWGQLPPCEDCVTRYTQGILLSAPEMGAVGRRPPIEELQHKQIREFWDWVHERALAQDGMNPGRTANKAREHLRAVISWAWEQELIDTLPRFPKPREQRDVAGRHYLTKAEINALYFATIR